MFRVNVRRHESTTTQRYGSLAVWEIHIVRFIARIVRRVWHRVDRDNCPDMAAEVSFYFVLSMFPFFLVMAALVGLLPSRTLWQSFTEWVVAYFPRLSRGLIVSTLLGLRQGYTGLISFGLLATLWSASSGFLSLMGALTIAYRDQDRRPYWRRRLIAMGATLGSAIFFLASFALWTTGHWAANSMSGSFHNFIAWEAKWKIAWWILTGILLCLGIDLLNYFLPAGRRAWKWLSPGTIFVAITFALGSLGLNLYVRYSPSLPRVYGTLAGFIILMMWIYVSTLILLIGAETDSAVNELKAEGASA
jgi:membrane protein